MSRPLFKSTFAGHSLKAYSLGLLGFILIKVLLPGFTSRGDMNTPVRYGVYAMQVSLGLNLALALATSLGAFFNAALLLIKLHKDKVYQPIDSWWLFFARVLLVRGVMAAGLFYFVDAAWWNDWSSTVRIINLVKWIGLGLVCYTTTLALTGLRLKHLAGQRIIA